jgi:hypothetical protein
MDYNSIKIPSHIIQLYSKIKNIASTNDINEANINQIVSELYDKKIIVINQKLEVSRKKLEIAIA